MTIISAKIIDEYHWRVVAHYDDGCETAFAENRSVSLEAIESAHAELHGLPGDPKETRE